MNDLRLFHYFVTNYKYDRLVDTYVGDDFAIYTVEINGGLKQYRLWKEDGKFYIKERKIKGEKNEL